MKNEGMNVKLKHFVSLRKGKNPSVFLDSGAYPYLTMDYLRGRDKDVKYADYNESLVLVKESEILILWDGANAGEIMQSKTGFLSSTMARITSINNNLTNCFLFYLLKNFESVLKDFAGGTTIPHLDPHVLLHSSFFIPSLEKQTAIANFLDDKTAKIDRAIDQKEKMIALLKERRQIVIQDLVTGKKVWNSGQNAWTAPAEVKDSGVDWIGEIPEGWEVKALKYIADLESGSTISSESFVEDGYPVFGGNGFRGFAATYTNEGKHALIGRQGALCGNVNYADGKFFASEHAIVVYHKKNVNVLWLGETIKVADFNRLSQSAAQPGIAVNVIKNEIFPFPSFEEQNRIAAQIESQSAKIDKAIALQEQQIEKLKELKATLIDGAVTGKIKVSEL